MGSCLSKKTTICSSPSALPDPPPDQSNTKTNPPQVAAEKKKPEEEAVKKEIFVIKHRKSHDIDRRSDEEKSNSDQKIPCTTTTSSSTAASESTDVGNNTSTSNGGFPNGGIVVRTSSCTKEEVDAILIQCGRLSRSSSTGKAPLSGSGGGSCGGRDRKYSGSKRSYDFDHETSDKKKGNGVEDGNNDDDIVDGGDDETVAERIHRHRQRHRQSRPSSSSSSRRRTPSRERDQQQQQRSGSRERGGSGGGGGRRVSRSPGRRSESPITGRANATPSSANAGGNNACNGSGRPGKMVSIPATVSSLAMDKSNNGGGGVEPPPAAAIKRISVKRNAGGEAAMGCRNAASPRSRSPARTNVRAANENQPLSLSRSNSRKAEHSPYRRNPLAEIDQNCIGFEVPLPSNKAANNILSQAPMQKLNDDNVKSNKVIVQGTDNKPNSGKGTLRAKDEQQVEDGGKGLQPMTGNVAMTVVTESLKPQTITRSRSSRLSRDLDLNPDAVLNPAPSSYTALLLEDIQNFHQKGTPAISLPPCVTKACSILEAVADLNSSTSSNLSGAVSDDRRKSPMPEHYGKEDNFSFRGNPVGKKRLESRDPFVESEVLVSNDLTEPSFHKYVTLRRGGTVGGGGDVEEQESSGSNSFVGGQQHWVPSSSWEPNSADSTDHWTSSMSNTREGDGNFQRHAFSEPRCHSDEAQRRMGEKKRESDDHQQTGIGRGRVSSSRGLHSTPPLAAAST